MDSPRKTNLSVAEGAEHLATIDRSVAQWEGDPSSARISDELLRALHSLKALASAMGCVQAAELAHGLEDWLGQLRASGNAPDQTAIQLLSDASDALREAVTAPGQVLPHRRLADLMAAVRTAAGASGAEPRRSSEKGWQVGVRLTPDASMPGARALVILQRAGELGKVVWVEPPESCFSRDDFTGEFSFGLVSDGDAAAIEAAVRRGGEVERVELAPASVPLEVPEIHGGRQMRVETARIESMTRLVTQLRSELAGIAALAAGDRSSELSERVGRISQGLERLEGELRAVKVTAVWRLFDRFPRMVRHISRTLGKQVEFVMRGRELEADRGILDQLADPILHLIRNAVDHGIESPAERVQAGKPPAGRVVLEAERSGSRLLVRVRDDGKGVDRESVLARGRAMGLVEPGVRKLTDEELLQLLAHPGFSTAASPTYVSGRGIGLDAVASRVGDLGGVVRLKTEAGRGSVFELELPGAFHD
jgi:two-component system chemotaxis sensor kinase CheA